MKTGNIFQEWASSVDLLRTRVIKFPSYIFLCGGEVSEGICEAKSCRDIFFQYVRDSQRAFRENVVLAEQTFDYFKHSGYGDLLKFEIHLAELSALTVIFSESAGSIAELGSFAVLKPIQERLLVVVNEDDADKESFIWRGPIMSLKNFAKEKGKDDPISVYKWAKRNQDHNPVDICDFPDAADLAEAIETLLKKLPKSQSLNTKQLGHVMLLTVDLLSVIQLATLDEIVYCLQLLSIQRERQLVALYLKLLDSLGLIIKKHYGNNVYYLSGTHAPWLSWAFNKEARVRDTDRWKSRFQDFYITSKQNQKLRALESHLKATKQIGD